MMVPEDVSRWLRAVADTAGQVDGATLVHVQVRTPQDSRSRHCNNQSRLETNITNLILFRLEMFCK